MYRPDTSSTTARRLQTKRVSHCYTQYTA